MTEDDRGAHSLPLRRTKLRIESLSDLVFGLALSIGSLFLIDRAPQNGEDLAFNVLLFGFGFFIIVITWLGYSRTMAVLPVEAPFALAANLALLFVVALEPYLFFVLFSSQSSGALVNDASVVYGLDVGSMFFLQASLARLVVLEERTGLHGQRALHPMMLARFKRVVTADVIVGLVFLVSTLPVFWVQVPVGGYLRFDLWTSSFFLFGLLFRSRRGKGEQRSPDVEN